MKLAHCCLSFRMSRGVFNTDLLTYFSWAQSLPATSLPQDCSSGLSVRNSGQWPMVTSSKKGCHYKCHSILWTLRIFIHSASPCSPENTWQKEKEKKIQHTGIFSVSAFFWRIISDISIVKVWELLLKEEMFLSLGVPWSDEHLSRIKQLLLIH